MPLLFQELFREKSKKDRCGGTQERKMNARKQRKSGKTTVTVNSVNPSCSSALKLYSASSFSAIALPRASHCAFTSGVIACFISTGSPTGS